MKTQSPRWPRGATAPTSSNPPVEAVEADAPLERLTAHRPALGGGEPPPPPPPPSAPPPLDLRDPAAVHRWQEGLRATLLDLAAAAQEGARRPHKRVLSRGEIRRQARDALDQATKRLDLAVAAATALRGLN